eukprot:356666-Chlamydomonas_euryale.AAC.1
MRGGLLDVWGPEMCIVAMPMLHLYQANRLLNYTPMLHLYQANRLLNYTPMLHLYQANRLLPTAYPNCARRRRLQTNREGCGCPHPSILLLRHGASAPVSSAPSVRPKNVLPDVCARFVRAPRNAPRAASLARADVRPPLPHLGAGRRGI